MGTSGFQKLSHECTSKTPQLPGGCDVEGGQLFLGRAVQGDVVGPLVRGEVDLGGRLRRSWRHAVCEGLKMYSFFVLIKLYFYSKCTTCTQITST